MSRGEYKNRDGTIRWEDCPRGCGFRYKDAWVKHRHLSQKVPCTGAAPPVSQGSLPQWALAHLTPAVTTLANPLVTELQVAAMKVQLKQLKLQEIEASVLFLV